MAGVIKAYPLQWPAGWKRTAAGLQQSGRFAKRVNSGYSYPRNESVSIAEAMQRLLAELDRMGVHADDVVISSNLALRLDGLPKSGQAEPADSGAAVYWRDAGRDRCMAIDVYTKVAQNIAALAATIEAMRAIERHGGAAILDRAFTGFTALPAPIIMGGARPWREVLDYGNSPADREAITRHFRTLAATAHPDKGGTDEAMAQLNAARDTALKECDD